jgi:protein-S-isoprenylcysteine O-methyltransferase Ste14
MDTPLTDPSMFLRHLLSIVLLPFLVVVVVPWALLGGSAGAPPTEHSVFRLVVAGPYRYVRNPMISGVALMLLGEAAFWGSGTVFCMILRRQFGGLGWTRQ